MESKGSNGHLYAHVHSNITHNSGQAEAAHVSIHRRTDKQNGVDAHDGILFSFSKEGNVHICFHLDEAQRRYAK